MVTRDGFSTVKEFLLDRFDKGYIMRTLKDKSINIRKPDKLVEVGIKHY